MKEITFEEPLIFVAEHIEMLDVSELIERKNNSKKHPPEQIARLAGGIREFGFVVPLLIDKRNRIVAGHGRKMAGITLGMRKFPCVRVEHLTEGQAQALVLFDNKIADSGFDEKLLKLEIEALRDLDEELLGLTGFDPKEIDAIIEGLDDLDGDNDEPTVKAPELRFGEHKIQLKSRELQALDMLAEIHLKKHGDFDGFVETTLLKKHK